MSADDDRGVAYAVALALFLLLTIAPLRAWALMVLIGVVHAEVLREVQPVGYWICLAMAALLGLVRMDSSGSAS